jgi:Zn-dependent protease with chaperone function
MTRSLAVACALLALAAIAGAAARDEEAARLANLSLDRLLEGQARIARVGDPIRVAGAPLCGDEVGPVLGVFTADARTFRDMSPGDRPFEKRLNEVATRRFDLRDRRRILQVAPRSPAERSGLDVGDLVLRVDGREPRRAELLDVLRRSGERVEIAIKRGGEEHTFAVVAPLGCAFPSRFWFGSGINAFATRFGELTGTYVISGMLDFLPADDDLAVVLGHELAHLIQGHVGTFRRSEADADYLGAYLAAAAGFDVSRAPGVWERFASENPYTGIDRGFYSHPPSPERAARLATALAEIEAVRSRGEPLVLPADRIIDRPQPDAAELAAYVDAMRARGREQLARTQARVIGVYTRLQTGGAPLCGERIAPVLGAAIARRRDFMGGREKEVKEAFGAGDEVTVLALAPNGPAETAGLAAGDRIVAVNGEFTPETPDVFDALRDAGERGPVLRVRRGAEELELALPPVLGCGYGVRIAIGSEPDPAADKNRKEILIPSALARVARTDDELAIGLAHQLAHHLLGSPLLLDPDDEPPADRLGLYIAARAGFDISRAAEFFDRLAAEAPWKLDSDEYAGRHVGTPARAPAIRAAVAEIESKLASGAPITP